MAARYSLIKFIPISAGSAGQPYTSFVYAAVVQTSSEVRLWHERGWRQVRGCRHACGYLAGGAWDNVADVVVEEDCQVLIVFYFKKRSGIWEFVLHSGAIAPCSATRRRRGVRRIRPLFVRGHRFVLSYSRGNKQIDVIAFNSRMCRSICSTYLRGIIAALSGGRSGDRDSACRNDMSV